MDQNSENPLVSAIKNDDLEALQQALQDGADPNQTFGDRFETPMHLAVEQGSVSLLEQLISSGGSIHAIAKGGVGLLHQCSYCEYPQPLLDYLLDAGLLLESRDQCGWTPLHFAIHAQNAPMVQYLLEHGANPYYPIGNNKNGHDLAVEGDNFAILEMLGPYLESCSPPEADEMTEAQGAENGQGEAVSFDGNEQTQSIWTVEEDRSNDESLRDLFSRSLTEWADNIPHHGVKDFGKQISLGSIFYRPTYLLGINNLYDNRKVLEKSAPFKGQPVPPREFNSPNDVDVWSYNLNRGEGFPSSREYYTLDGSQYVTTCGRCSGQGKIQCPSCHGKGKETCSSCSGSGSTRCGSCYGSGRTSCSSCGGSGYKQRWVTDTTYDSEGSPHYTNRSVSEPCSSCGSSGKRTCSSCGGSGKKTCSTCGGRGEIVCGRCHGTGSITCPTCQGMGQMLNYYSMEHNLSPYLYTRCIHDADVFERYPNFYIEPQGTTGDIKINNTLDQLPDDLLDDTHISNVYREVLDISRKESPFKGQGGRTRLCRQNATVVQMDVYDIDYSYEGKDYHLLIWGYDDKFQVYSSESPFSELRDQFLDKARKRQGLRMWGKSFNWLDKADDMDIHDECEEIYQMKETIEGKMFRQYRFGAIWGSLAAGAGLGWWTFNFYKEPRFYLQSLKDYFMGRPTLQQVHPIVMTLLFAVYLIFSHNRALKFMKEFYGNKIRHEWVRWLFPPLVAAFFALMVWAGLWVVNASGASLVLSRVIEALYNAVLSVIQWFGAQQGV